MSQSTTATLDLPRPARRPAPLPAPVLAAVAVLVLAHVPILLAHMHVLSMKPHYEFYPLVFVGAAVLAGPAYRLVRAGRRDGGWARPGPAVWRAGLALLAVNALLLAAAVV